MQRHPAVAGQFYPDGEQELRKTLDAFLVSNHGEDVVGAISPHAGYVYSGAVAGAVFSQINVPSRVVILGPNHHGLGHQAALFSSGSWLTPLGESFVDREFAESVLEDSPDLKEDVEAHRYEHSLEVQLPFIQMKNPQARIVPICIGLLSLPELLRMGESLARTISSAVGQTLLVASTDMTHYEPADVARVKDMRALEYVLDVDPEGLYRTVREGRISMCGVLPTVVMLSAARQLGSREGTLVRYANSGDVTGETSQVVGYAGAFVRK